MVALGYFAKIVRQRSDGSGSSHTAPLRKRKTLRALRRGAC